MIKFYQSSENFLIKKKSKNNIDDYKITNLIQI